MITKPNSEEIAYKKARKRVKEIKNYYYFVGGYVLVAVILLYKDYDENMFGFKQEYTLIMLGLQALFLIGYGLYLFIPALHQWEERKIKKLYDQYKNKKDI